MREVAQHPAIQCREGILGLPAFRICEDCAEILDRFRQWFGKYAYVVYQYFRKVAASLAAGVLSLRPLMGVTW